MHNSCRSLVIGEDEGISDHHILPSASVEDDHFCYVIWCQRLAAATFISLRSLVLRSGLPIDCIRFGFVPIEADDGELCFDLTRIDLHHPYPCGNQFFPQCIRKCSHCSFGRTIDRARWVTFAASDTSYVDDITPTAFIPLLEDR